MDTPGFNFITTVTTTGNINPPKKFPERQPVKEKEIQIGTIHYRKIKADEAQLDAYHPGLSDMLQEAVENLEPLTRHEQIRDILEAENDTAIYETPFIYQDEEFVYFRVIDTIVFVEQAQLLSESVEEEGAFYQMHPSMILFLLCIRDIDESKKDESTGQVYRIRRNGVPKESCQLLTAVYLRGWSNRLQSLSINDWNYTHIAPPHEGVVFRRNPDRWEMPVALVLNDGRFLHHPRPEVFFDRLGVTNKEAVAVIDNAEIVYTAAEWDALERKPLTHLSVWNFKSCQWVDDRSIKESIDATKMKLKDALHLFIDAVKAEMDDSTISRCLSIGMLPEQGGPMDKFLNEGVRWKRSSAQTVMSHCDRLMVQLENAKDLRMLDVAQEWLSLFKWMCCKYADSVYFGKIKRVLSIEEYEDDALLNELVPGIPVGEFTSVVAIAWFIMLLEAYFDPSTKDKSYGIMKKLGESAPKAGLRRSVPDPWFYWD